MNDRMDWFLRLAALGVIILALALLISTARAHQAPSGWAYPPQCCSTTDCNEIPASAVREGPDGYEVTLQPGMHDFVNEATGPKSWLIPYAKAKNSPDGAYHLCISKVHSMLCFFAGAKGV